MLCGRREKFRCRPLERINRLFGVTHGKDGAQAGSAAFTGKKIIGQQFENIPLDGARVLGLIHQQMIDPLIELE